jgi:hypothetical protein
MTNKFEGFSSTRLFQIDSLKERFDGEANIFEMALDLYRCEKNSIIGGMEKWNKKGYGYN